ncbi:MAG: T9SS type A sorting domain-containing protein [Ignavibacteriaceae bacterium]|jgi:hypothetical protein|nr:T9SS type A sorting domain-containing protein [Ignavibacteriaceae bacterium]
MNHIKITLLILLLFSSFLLAQEERKVLVEVFTNSHCPLCPTAHNVINNYLAGTNGNKISYIYYHMVYPYNYDLLYLQSQEGSDARDNYYGPFFSTPRGWFDGEAQGNSSGWAATLDNLVATTSPLKIILSGTRDANQFNINAQLTRTGNIPDSDLVIHFVVAEDVYYAGNNGITNHKHVMRKMLPTPDGQSFSINLNETKNFPQTIDLDPIWDADSLNIVVFVQSMVSKTVYQSALISYDELNVTDAQNEGSVPSEFKLEQNYPNPFNPSTTISWQSPVGSHQTLKVFDLLGSEVAILVDEEKPAGSYEISFDASDLPSGTYFYQLQIGNFVETKKMLIIK